jgi:signal transduction histidine kinase
MLKQLVRESSLLAPDFYSFKRQEFTFVSLNLILLAALLLIHALFASYLGKPPAALLVVLAAGFAANLLELMWLIRSQPLQAHSIVALTWTAIAVNMSIAFTLATLSFSEDIQYFVLMIAPVLQAAFRLSLRATLVIVVSSGGLMFFWVWNYFRLHPPLDPVEFIEAGTIAVIYAVAGTLVWILVNFLRSKQVELSLSLAELEKARERLFVEEKLAAVGRFSAAIAHEIRNPVAMISSALTTAFNQPPESPDRREMFEIAGREASRLEKLTSDFLAYARPRTPSKERSDVTDSLGYVMEICRPRAAETSVTIRMESPPGLWVTIDEGQFHQALLNLAINAVEATPSGGVVILRGTRVEDRIRIDVDNDGGAIPPESAARIFEPFFTTKPTGTGLGLAIAHNIVRAMDGDLHLDQNRMDLVRFSIFLPEDARERRAENDAQRA